MTDELAPVSHVPGDQNPADLGTRGQVSLGDLGPGSTWQKGPDFLQQDYSVGPAPQKKKSPEWTSLKTSADPLLAWFSMWPSSQPMDPFRVIGDQVGTSSRLGEVMSALCSQVLKREKLEMLVRVLGRVLQAVVGGGQKPVPEGPLGQNGGAGRASLAESSIQGLHSSLERGQVTGIGRGG